MPPTPSPNERLWAALAHGSVILSFFGPIAPALIWVIQRRKSPYAAFHALQAMGYQMLTYWVGMTVYLLFAIVILLFMSPSLAALAQSPDPLAEMSAFPGSLLLYGFFAVYFLVGIVGAALSWMGRDFQIPLLGARLARYLGRGESPAGPLDEAKSEQWVAGVCHGSAILFLFGIFTPLVVWLAEKDKSPRLRFQSMQALVYQALGTMGYFGFTACYSAFAIWLISSLMPILTGQGVPPSVGGFFIVSVLIALLLMLVAALALPTYHLFAMIAGIQVVRGRDYRYPLLGRWLARKFADDRPDVTLPPRP